MDAGPSKEQLESLFKTSRKYFDEMAKEYYAKDRDFYNKNFAPFYNNPFAASKKVGKSPALFLTLGLSIAIAIAGFVTAFFFSNGSSDNKPVRQSVKYKEPDKVTEDKPASSINDSSDKENIKLQNLKEELIQKESEVKENTGKREVRNKPVERQR